jgi:hypothetical protein
MIDSDFCRKAAEWCREKARYDSAYQYMADEAFWAHQDASLRHMVEEMMKDLRIIRESEK